MKYHDPQNGLLILMALYAVALAIAGLGAVRVGPVGPPQAVHRGGGNRLRAAAALLVVSPTWHIALVAAPLLGFGFGTYWAAAPAVLTAVLPAATDRAKDLGILNIAYSLPLVVAPLVAGVVLGLMNSYPALFALAGVVTVIAGLTVSGPFGTLTAYTKSI